MDRWWRRSGEDALRNCHSIQTARLVTDGGDAETDADEEASGDDADTRADEGVRAEDIGEQDTEATGLDERDGDAADEGDTTDSELDRSNVEVADAGGIDPADPKWEKPDPDDIPEFEVRTDQPRTKPSTESPPGGKGASTPGDEDTAAQNQAAARESEDPTAGMPNTARTPGDSRIKREGTQGYIAALELCARLPEDIRLPEAAADLVPAAVEAELEQDIRSFAAAEFDNQSPHVDILEFVERDGDIWLRLRLGIPSEAFADLDPDEVRSHALQELEGLL